ncbi:MAG: hypothetical protein UHU19_10310 [Lachnospiraceae bacterium]|nr:hypothetical protein [Lachnospiraceae bacterium]
MNENLNLCEILKDCSKGTKLYCTFLGDVLFSKIVNNKIFVHIGNTEYSFYSDGKFFCDGECVLFPSREQRDWSKFRILIKKFDPKDFKPFDKVLLRDGYGFKWCPTFLEKILKESSGEYSAVELINGCKWNMCIPYNEETKHLCWTTKDCPEYYKWWKK